MFCLCVKGNSRPVFGHIAPAAGYIVVYERHGLSYQLGGLWSDSNRRISTDYSIQLWHIFRFLPGWIRDATQLSHLAPVPTFPPPTGQCGPIPLGSHSPNSLIHHKAVRFPLIHLDPELPSRPARSHEHNFLPLLHAINPLCVGMTIELLGTQGIFDQAIRPFTALIAF